MALESACQLPTGAKYWQAAERKGAISLPFLMSTEVKNNIRQNIFMNSLLLRGYFFILVFGHFLNE
jgi:hypothetical protein